MDQQLKQLIAFKPKNFNHWRIHALVSVILEDNLPGAVVDAEQCVKSLEELRTGQETYD